MKEPIYINTKHRLITMLSSIALVACCALGVSAGQIPTYNLTDLGVLPDQQDSSPAAINDQGQVAGTSGMSAFRYTSARKQPMEDVARQSAKGISRGFGIDGSGMVVGDSTFGKDFSHAAVFSNGSAMDLGTLKEGGDFSRANDINGYGQVVGFSSQGRDSESGRAFIVNAFDRSSMIDLSTLGGLYAQAWGINDSGFVTGNSQIKSEFGATHAFIWQKMAAMLDLGTLAGDFSYGTFINEKNHVVGYSTIDKNNDRVHAFLYDGNKMLDLGSLGGAALGTDLSYALGVNASDQVVGYSYLPIDRMQKVAFLYSKGLMVDLNNRIGAAVNDYRLVTATAINNKGQIVAIAWANSAAAYRAVLLTPMVDVTPAVQVSGSATYAVKQRLLTIQATCTGGGPSTTPPTLSVYATGSSDTLIGTLSAKGGGTYIGSFFLENNPLMIMVESSNGGRADVKVDETSLRDALSGN